MVFYDLQIFWQTLCVTPDPSVKILKAHLHLHPQTIA